ncbi:MAG TPA: hypothetical protein VMV49_00850 [Candidatus Deferrimicrobium sp.]|nr:hypothetical protein [Candidatus Deferrimicrobium sp.]
MSENNEKWWKKLIILGIFIGIVAITAKVDWGAEHPELGIGFQIFWLCGILLTLGLVLPIAFMYFAGNQIHEKGESDKKWFIIALILYAIANGIPVIFYVVLEQPPGFLLFLQLGLFGLIPAFILQPKSLKLRYIIIIVLFAAILAPLAILILGVDPFVDKFLYYLFFWGLFSVFLYLLIAIGWKFGGGTRRQSWNIFMAGMLIQYSTLEDFMYFFLNGQALPGTWPWMSDFVINLEALFGHVPTDFDLLIFCLIITSIAILILFDVYGYIWDRFLKKK